MHIMLLDAFLVGNGLASNRLSDPSGDPIATKPLHNQSACTAFIMFMQCSWDQINVGSRPKANSMLICAKFGTKGASQSAFSGYFVDSPSPVELIVTVHGPSIPKSDEHCFGLTCDTNHHLIFNQMFTPGEGAVGQPALFDFFSNEGFAKTVRCTTDFRAFWHEFKSNDVRIKICIGNRWKQEQAPIPTTMAQEVVMLGTGNAFLPYGRYHSFAMIDGKHIIDCPPTALASFRREGHLSSKKRIRYIVRWGQFRNT